MKIVRAYIELEFDEDIEERMTEEAVDEIPMFKVRRSADGSIVGNSRILGIEFPLPAIARVEFDPNDIVWEGFS